MNFVFKLGLSIAVIILCTQIGSRLPSLAGLVATMPLTGLIVLIWLHLDHPGDTDLLLTYTKGALFGILPSILFFLVAFFCLQHRLSLPVALAVSFAIWLLGAFLHQCFLN